MKAPRSRHYLLYLDEQKNANFGQIVDRFFGQNRGRNHGPTTVIFFKTEKKLASD